MQYLIGDDYRLQWVIGHGGMSTVWLADDARHDREVAIKSLRPEFSNSTEFLERFRNEAQAAENITSENVVHTYDYREVSDSHGTIFCFIVMEYVRGESLADLLSREGSLPEAMALDVMEQAAHGLAAIHALGMVHRDIKPGNLMVTQEGKVKITDFGIAKAAAAVPLTRTGMVVGTAQYVSPEQAQGQEVGSTSDVYSLGVVGYEVLSGKRPFTGDSSVSVVLAHINQAPPALSTSISAQTRELIGIALRKEPGRRFTNGNEMAQAISQVRLGNRPPQPRSAVLTRPAPEPSPTAATVALGAVAQPTTVQPAATPKRQIVSPPVPPARKVVDKPKEEPKREGMSVGLALAAALAVLLVVGFALYRMDFFSTDSSAPESSSAVPTQETAVVTQYVEQQAPAQGNNNSGQSAQSATQQEPQQRSTRETREAEQENSGEREQEAATVAPAQSTVVEEPEQEAPQASNTPDTPAQVNEDNSDVQLLTSEASGNLSEDAEGDVQ
ncbi:protein kinase domain-containing protein [Corynebacterium sp. 22KM0430]|uniref:serine/threonine-protein kinase n=1 Tax=unclassified Corynebacterium TaxID=2624378 RepID=UPI0039B0EE92